MKRWMHQAGDRFDVTAAGPEEVDRIAAGELAVVKLFSPRSAPCIYTSGGFRDFAEEHRGELPVVGVDVDRHPEMAARFGASAVPAFIFLAHGEVRARLVGVKSRQELDDALGTVRVGEAAA
jgi:thioredoxin-like negative regulator of GroEL